MERLIIHLSDLIFKKLTLMTGFVVHGHKYLLVTKSEH